MKKVFAAFLVLALLAVSGCSYAGYDFVDTNYHFNRAIIRMPDGAAREIQIKKWADSEDGEQLTLTSADGTRYLVHSANCILIEDP